MYIELPKESFADGCSFPVNPYNQITAFGDSACEYFTDDLQETSRAYIELVVSGTCWDEEEFTKIYEGAVDLEPNLLGSWLSCSMGDGDTSIGIAPSESLENVLVVCVTDIPLSNHDGAIELNISLTYRTECFDHISECECFDYEPKDEDDKRSYYGYYRHEGLTTINGVSSSIDRTDCIPDEPIYYVSEYDYAFVIEDCLESGNCKP